MAKHVITANRLIDGLVVYLSASGGWVEAVSESLVAAAEAALEVALETGRAAEAGNHVVGVYEIEVDGSGPAMAPVSLRERIRAFGPTTHPEFGRTTESGHYQHSDGVEPVRFGDA
ncbi:MAG: DUF2849 domain-containing protein [Magnetovibrio sp.]|nr:DUF2849 domain-containing protein [Magnetovibrio sp.]